MTGLRTTTRQQRIESVRPEVAALLAGAAGWEGREWTFVRELATTVPGSEGYRLFRTHLTVDRDDLAAQLDRCSDPFTLSPAQLLAEALAWVPSQLTVAVWEKDSDRRNPRRRRAADWCTTVAIEDQSPQATAARAVCSARRSSPVGEALHNAHAEAMRLLSDWR